MSEKDNYCHYSGHHHQHTMTQWTTYKSRYSKPKQKRVTVMKRLIQRYCIGGV